MGSSINETDLIELEKSLFKTKMTHPVIYNIIFITLSLVFITFILLFYYLL